MADMPDSKSGEAQASCRFKSDRRQKSPRPVGRILVAAALAGLLASVGAFGADARYPTRALVVVDIQEDCTGGIVKPPFLFQKDSTLFIEKLNALITRAAAVQVPVVYLRTNLKMQDVPGAKLDRRLKVVGTDCFLKDSLDAFASSNHQFTGFLSSHKAIAELDVVGLDAALCVYETAKTAARKGYLVRVVKDAILTISGKSSADLETMYAKVGIQTTTREALLGTLQSAGTE
jgi:nicotinamidase-related amidase